MQSFLQASIRKVPRFTVIDRPSMVRVCSLAFTTYSLMTASNLHTSKHAPQRIHLPESITCVFFFSPEMATVGHCFLHNAQPVQFSASMRSEISAVQRRGR